MDGVLIINKQKNISSQGVVSKVKKILGEKKVGHSGTLDPLATGVLPILVGKGTKISKYLIEHDKVYLASLKFGVKTTTGDYEGDIVKTDKFNIKNYSIESIQNVLNTFLGRSSQLPPMYSAIKVNGKKLYEYARQGEKIDVKPREIEIYKINLNSVDFEKNEISFVVMCSKGTYIRSLCEDIAEKFGTVGFMSNLIRLQVDKFNISSAITLDTLETVVKNNEKLKDCFYTIEEIFNSCDKIVLPQQKLNLLLNGVVLNIQNKDGIVKVYDENNNFIGIAIAKDNTLKRDVII